MNVLTITFVFNKNNDLQKMKTTNIKSDKLKTVRTSPRTLEINFKEQNKKMTLDEIIERGEQQIRAGKVTRIDPQNIWQNIE